MNDTLIKEISYSNGLTEKIAIIGDTKNKLKLKGSYILANKDEILMKTSNQIKKSFIFDDIGVKSAYFGLTIICAIILVVTSAIIMHFAFRIQ